jgi:hypothetical protein
MAGFLLMLGIAVALVAVLVAVMGGRDRYAEMSKEEFEEEARRKSPLGAAIAGLEGTLRKREATILMEAKGRVESDRTPSPGEPPEELSSGRALGSRPGRESGQVPGPDG